MKSLKIFGTVLGFHTVLLLSLLFYPGCQTIETQTPIRNRTFSKKNPEPVSVENPELVDDSILTSIPIDGAFNDGIEKTSGQKDRYPPQRPPVLLQMEEDSSFTGDLDVIPPQDSFNEETTNKNELSTEVNENTRSIEYVVKPGDSLWALAKKFGLSTTALAEENGISNNAVLQIEQILKIPQNTSITAKTKKLSNADIPNSNSSDGLFSYTVIPGDSLSLVAKEQGTSVTAIRSLNQIVGDKILVGQTLLLPNRETKEEKILTKNEVETLNQTDALIHTVKSGDSLSKIANHYKVSLKDLMEWNQIKNRNRISVGKKLRVSPNNPIDQSKISVQPKGKASAEQKNALTDVKKSETSEKSNLEVTETVLKPIDFEQLLKIPEDDKDSEKEVKIIKVE